MRNLCRRCELHQRVSNAAQFLYAIRLQYLRTSGASELRNKSSTTCNSLVAAPFGCLRGNRFNNSQAKRASFAVSIVRHSSRGRLSLSEIGPFVFTGSLRSVTRALSCFLNRSKGCGAATTGIAITSRVRSPASLRRERPPLMPSPCSFDSPDSASLQVRS